MICPDKFYQSLIQDGVNFFAGVPDSLLKHFCSCVADKALENHVITANEGGAMAMAMGSYLASAAVPCVYMQNSGLGNAINPLLSMADSEVYGFPLIMLIGWRGEVDLQNKQIHDEPQHKKQGQVTLSLLNTMKIPYCVIDAETSDYQQIIKSSINQAQTESKPVAIVVRKNTFEKYSFLNKKAFSFSLTREEAISSILDQIPNDASVVSTTGKTSRELFELREIKNTGHQQDFLVVGAMGHTSQIVAGIKHSAPHKTVICLDGDGSCLMHLGSLTINSSYDFCHIVLNNGAHESVGGQPTVALDIDLPKIAIGCGYKTAVSVDNVRSIQEALRDVQSLSGAHLIEIKIKQGSRKDLGRPTINSQEMKMLFMGHIQQK